MSDQRSDSFFLTSKLIAPGNGMSYEIVACTAKILSIFYRGSGKF